MRLKIQRPKKARIKDFMKGVLFEVKRILWRLQMRHHRVLCEEVFELTA